MYRTVIENEIQVFHHMGVEIPKARLYAYGHHYQCIQNITIFYFQYATESRTDTRFFE